MASEKGLYVTEIIPYEQHTHIECQLLLQRAPAGFPSPVDGDILVVDRSLEAVSNDIVVAVLNGDLVVKKLEITNDRKIRLIASNSSYTPIEITPDMKVEIWGVVTYSLHPHKFKRIP